MYSVSHTIGVDYTDSTKSIDLDLSKEESNDEDFEFNSRNLNNFDDNFSKMHCKTTTKAKILVCTLL